MELPLDALGVVVATLFPVQGQRFAPGFAGLVVLSEGGVGVSDAVEGLRILLVRPPLRRREAPPPTRT
ncbi:hypothetical protein GCM10027184_72430 [Saccharothrix stipae]